MTQLRAEETGAPTAAPRPGSSWLRYIGLKAGGAAVSLVMVIMLGFFAFRILPGDPVRSLADGRQVTAEQMDILRRQYGLDQPMLVQFWRYLTDLFQGRLGESYTYNRPVMELILDRIGPTLLLTGTAALLSVVLGLWLGQRAAWRRGSAFDKAQTGVALLFWSVPTFWLGLLLLLIFGGGLRWFPTGGMITAGSTETGLPMIWDVARHLVLPVLTLVAVVYAQYLMVMRASLLEEMTSAYLVTARAKGLREDDVRRKHAVPNALLPTVTLIFLTLGGLVGGAVTVETVFSWPGLGYLTFQALSAPDYPLLQGTFVVFSAIVVVMNFFADVMYRVLDPRLRTA
ncbi:ABC transporter permease [Cryobacterium sp. MLB-32]|uniref:ABC transporter permease n=1 Tax=Cryobacterium sp. MLB-32 TaxID=1529318 RepID=UPI0004E799C4|nr:ABC transporter permease [Cryobacterium sp. MLB-32]KFF60223.1 ABC transporter permease [Cryobacterium sp. MLB-32]